MGKSIATDRGAQAAKPDQDGKQLDYVVTGERGLRLRVTGDKAGNVSKVWSLLYTRKSDGKRCRITLGAYPAMTLANARALAGAHRNDVFGGADPARSKREEKRALTFESLALCWLESYAKKNRRSWPESERVLKKDVLPVLGAMKADAITKRDVIVCSNAILDRGAPVLANRVQSLIFTIFSWACGEDILDRNPLIGIRKRHEEASRERRLSDEEVRTFWQALDSAKMQPVTADVLRLCLLTGQRVNEIAQAPKAEFDLAAAVWNIPAARTKNGTPHRLPLPRRSIAILQAAFERSPCSAYAFPTPAKLTDSAMTLGAVGKAWIRSRADCGLDTTVHDLRRTFASFAGDLGLDDFHIGLVLNHLGGRSKVTSIYNRAQYDPQKRMVLEAVEHRLFEIIEGREPNTNVVPSRGGAGL
jgi:integrase